MRVKFSIRCLVLVLGSLLAGNSVAAATSEEEPATKSPGAAESLSPVDSWILSQASSIGRPGANVSDVRKRLLFQFQQADIDGVGVSQSDFELAKKLALAQSRAGQLAQEWLARDLDGDGAVSRAEIEVYFTKHSNASLNAQVKPTPEQAAAMLKKLSEQAMEADKDGDGVVTISEMIVSLPDRGTRQFEREYDRIPLALDLDGNGTISSEEFLRSVDRVLGSLDTDGDAKFSETEVQNFKKEQQRANNVLRSERQAQESAARRGALKQACGFPPAPADAKIVLMQVNRGEGLATIGLGDKDRQVTVADIFIESGKDPLYIAIGTAFTPIIFRFSGATDRVSTAVVTSRTLEGDRPLVGVVGLPKERVYIPLHSKDQKTWCLRPFNQADSSEALEAGVWLEDFLGRKPDVILAIEHAGKINLPDGKIEPAKHEDAIGAPKDATAANLWEYAFHKLPGGTVQIEPSALVAKAEPRQLSVLPGDAGLVQLIDAGSLKVIGTKKTFLLKGFEFVGGGGSDQIRYPPGSEPLSDREADRVSYHEATSPSGRSRSNLQICARPRCGYARWRLSAALHRG